ncbi:ABC transporter ATP-binding protein [Rhizorhabdus dicambivorans]|uniref:ABC transporter ATP-binding protein n=1 Tax=Rhizorhabdus dicambivorans TaxID=1850238 RepID=A0A2A4FX63_9SPHN|nr:ABC transporter ATP-binding protein [Rhizorhabdus dicambivorans]ATE65359.1 ABC transporter ATP-binding protein [Rhizorhabdus dicambivorans]PCE42311.1 ABC transporter ATP-binding protein [Rhizorhabdus dicambivorans]
MVSLSIEALRVTLGSAEVLHGIDAAIAPGALVGVIGPNGAGKSTLARAITGLVVPAAGRVLIDGADVRTLARAALARRIAYLPQGQTVHWPLTVERLVALGRLPHLAPFSAVSAEDRMAIGRAMERADIGDLAGRIVTELSGGERARALIARALAVEATALIVDEPLAALDPGHQLQLMDLLKAEAAAGSLVIAVLHDLAMAARFCDRLLLIHEGRLVADGTPSAVLTAENLERCYHIRAWTGTIEDQAVVLPLSRS